MFGTELKFYFLTCSPKGSAMVFEQEMSPAQQRLLRKIYAIVIPVVLFAVLAWIWASYQLLKNLVSPPMLFVYSFIFGLGGFVLHTSLCQIYSGKSPETKSGHSFEIFETVMISCCLWWIGFTYDKILSFISGILTFFRDFVELWDELMEGD